MVKHLQRGKISKGRKTDQSQADFQTQTSGEGNNVENGRGIFSSADGNQPAAIFQEESIPSTTHYYSPVPRPGSGAAELQTTGTNLNLRRRVRTCPNITKAIQRISRATQRVPRQRIPRQANNQQSSDNSQVRPQRKVNHRKYTVKKCSNFLRKALKQDGFTDFHKLEGDRNRRGSTIYLPVSLKILQRRLTAEKFKTFIRNYLNELENLQASEQGKLTNEKSRHYIHEFKRAREAIKLFAQGKERECIETFFGANEASYKERTYLQDSINFYNEWNNYLQESSNSLNLIEIGLNQEQREVELMEIETPIWENLIYPFATLVLDDNIDQFLTF